MRRGITAFFAVLLAFLLLSACGAAPQGRQVTAGMPDSPETPAPSPDPTARPTSAPSLSPVPGVDAPWYDARNTELFELIKRDGPARSDAEIRVAIDQMFIDPDKPMVALTFDDGPMPGVTDKILDILERYHVRATFFVCGWRFQQKCMQDIARRMVSLGCEIGNHTMDHADLSKQNIV
ncbi:MAG: polysaccharide deacetylase family protein [Christensenella sp.]|nr:polysaccharide deacetylase family protein [Christensenella sp.]